MNDFVLTLGVVVVMRKFFFALLAMLGVVLFSAMRISQAKNCPLSDIGAYKFFQGMGYTVPCQIYQTQPNGDLLFNKQLPEEGMAISGNLANVYVYAEPHSGKIYQVNLFFNANAENKVIGNVIAKAMYSIEGENAWQSDRSKFVNCLFELLNSPAETKSGYFSNAMGSSVQAKMQV